MASASIANVDRRERLRQLALETIDLTKVNTLSFFSSSYFLEFFFPHYSSSTGSVFYEKSLGIVRMQTLFDSTQ